MEVTMNKKIFLLGFVLVTLTIFGKVFVYANTPKTVIFFFLDDKKISVSTNQTFSEQKNSSTEISTVKAGDIIEIDSSQEIVIGVSDDGRYITMPLEDYQFEHQNN